MTGLIVKKVIPESSLWPIFLQINYEYMQENWPDKVSKGADAFYKEYGDVLIKRSVDVGRGLFIYNLGEDPVGIANVYLEEDKLNIAEFYVVPFYRELGVGKKMLAHLAEWGQAQGADILSLEVDKNLQHANAFWNKFDLLLDSSGPRNIYSCKIASNPKLKIKF